MYHDSSYVPQLFLCTTIYSMYHNFSYVPQFLLCTTALPMYHNSSYIPQLLLCTTTPYMYHNFSYVPDFSSYNYFMLFKFPSPSLFFNYIKALSTRIQIKLFLYLQHFCCGSKSGLKTLAIARKRKVSGFIL